MVRSLYVSLVRPHLEFAILVWNPYLKKYVKKLKCRMTSDDVFRRHWDNLSDSAVNFTIFGALNLKFYKNCC